MKQVLQLSTRQQLKMTPQLQQAIELLQLSALELEERIKQAVESNPMLESAETETPPPDLSVDTDWSSADVPTLYLAGNGKTEHEEFSGYANTEISLQEHLLWQLNLTPFSDLDRILALTIIDSIREDGYLGTSLEDIYNDLKTTYPTEFAELDLCELEAVLHRVQQFDPLGVASRNLQECLLIQLNALPTQTIGLPVAKKIVSEYLNMLAKRNFAEVTTKMRITDLQFTSAFKLIKQMHPRPGELIASKAPEYIAPDVIVAKQHNRWHVSLAIDLTVGIRINPEYAGLVNRKGHPRDAEYLRTQLTEAKCLLNGIQNRNITLLKVASSIVERQKDFLEHGEEHMRPMILQDIAEETGFNESTISRVTTKKYIHTPRGIFELKYFFSSHLTNSSGHDYSSIAIKAIIKQLISKETAHNPLSDQELCALMQDQGLKVARRTIAKYRESLGIRSSSQRKSK